MDETPLDLRIELLVKDIRHSQVARKLRMDKSLLSRILKGQRRFPQGFRERFDAAVAEVLAERREHQPDHPAEVVTA